MDKDLLVGTYYLEDVVIIDDRLAPSQEQVTSVVEGHMKDGKQISLQDILKIDEKIAAADQIQLSEWRILEYVVLRKYDHLTDLVPNDIVVALAGKEAAQPGNADILTDVVSVNASSCHSDGLGIQIGRKDLDVSPKTQILHDFRKENGDRIGLLTCRTARDPNAELIGLRRVFDQVVDHPVLEHFKIVRIPEEAGHSDQHFLGQKPGFVRIVG